jgi:hypothetical protein
MYRIYMIIVQHLIRRRRAPAADSFLYLYRIHISLDITPGESCVNQSGGNQSGGD